jgi:hypothetical protein
VLGIDGAVVVVVPQVTVRQASVQGCGTRSSGLGSVPRQAARGNTGTCRVLSISVAPAADINHVPPVLSIPWSCLVVTSGVVCAVQRRASQRTIRRRGLAHGRLGTLEIVLPSLYSSSRLITSDFSC